MTQSERLDSIEDALRAGAITLKQAAILFYDAYAHDTYCYRGAYGDTWYAWLGDRKDETTGYRGVRVALPATDAQLYGTPTSGQAGGQAGQERSA